MLDRFIKNAFIKSLKAFPVLILTGARQTGKSTLCKNLLLKTHRYVSLEDPDVRKMALEDPRTFLKVNPPPVILDEIQYAPDLPSYIQGIVDQIRTHYSQYVLTGSQNFLLMENVSQSLAGRAALMTLYPCSVAEADGKKAPARAHPDAVADWVLRGGFPELRTRPELDRRTWCSSYIRLVLERDVSRLLNVGDLDRFERFLHLVAIRTGQLLNESDLARDAGISVSTARKWLSVLQASCQIFLLRPYHANLSKRLIKAPKIYFGDTALASYLMGLHDADTLIQGPFLGPLFETAVFLEHMKWKSFQERGGGLTFFRTKDGLEVDLMIEDGRTIHAREIKTSRTMGSQMGEALLRAEKLFRKPLTKTILAPLERRSGISGDIELRPWHDVEW